MPRLSYRAFLWVFAAGNAIVWFLILYGLGLFLHAHLARDGWLTRQSAARMVCFGLLIPSVLSLQGAIVNLRVQFLLGRFLSPADLSASPKVVRSPWYVAVTTAAIFWAVGLPVFFGMLYWRLPEGLGARGVALLMGGVGALSILMLAAFAGDRELRSYLRVMDEPTAMPISAARYAVCRIAIPWGVVNAVINAVLAWITYSVSAGGAPAVLLGDLRADLAVMAFLISVFMALSALPEVETDFRRNVAQVPAWLPSMPRLWVRYGYALGVGLATYAAVTAAAASGVSSVSLATAVVAKSLISGAVATGAAGACALWGLGRCAHRRAPRDVDVLAPATAL